MTETDTILVVDDNPDIRTLLSRFFEARERRCVTAESAEQAGRILAGDSSIVAVLVDVFLAAGVSGLAWAKEISRLGPAVVVTSGHPDSIAAVEQSGLCFVSKPYRLDDLLRTIDGAIERKAG